MQKKISHRARGDRGEKIAKKFLLEKGWKFLEENFCVKGGEIDLIFEHDQEIIFVEVKLRKNGSFGTAAESITPGKIRHLVYSAQRYFAQHKKNWFSDPFRFDVVAIEEEYNGERKISHYEYAFGFDDF